MKSSTLLFTLLIFFIGCQNKSDDVNQIRACFNNYKDAIMAGDGEESLKYVDENTLDFYKRVQEKTLSADSSDIQSMPLIEKLTVLTARHKIPVDQLRQFTGSSFFTYAVDNGLIGRESVQSLELGTVKVSGDHAESNIITNGQQAPFGFDFNKENERWKIDLTSIFDNSTLAFRQIMAESGMSETEYLLMLLELMDGDAPGEGIWNPIEG